MKRFLVTLLVALAACTQPDVPAEYRAALSRVCDGIDDYGMALSLEGSGSIVEQAIEAERSRKAAGEAFAVWVALDVPDVPAVRGPVEAFRAADFDLIGRPAELLSQCRAVEALLGQP
jgi:hypothetical protein